jgi:hypothetical protein
VLPDAHNSSADHFQHFHDFCVVRAPQISQCGALEGRSDQLGHRFLRVLLSGPANRIGSYEFSAAQLKTIQEVITLSVFSIFSITFLGESLKWNYVAGFACISLTVFFVFHQW